MLDIRAMNLEEWLAPASVLLVSIILGFLFERVILLRLRMLAKRTTWKWDELVIRSIRGLTFLWFFLAGVYFASLFLPMEAKYSAHLDKALLVVLIVSATLALARLTAGFFKAYTETIEGVLPSASILTNLTYIVVFVVGILTIFHSLGVSIAPILTALGVGGLAVALALQDTLSNLFAGLQVILSKQVRRGDYIKLESGEEGYVEDITWRNATIRQLPNNLVIIPNSKLSGAIVTNYDAPEPEMSVLVDLGVAYNSDLEKVERVTIEVAKEVMREVDGGVPTFEPFIRYHTFGDSSINFTAILRAREFVNQYVLRHEFVKRLHKRFNEEGIEIPFPIRTVYMGGEKPHNERKTENASETLDTTSH